MPPPSPGPFEHKKDPPTLCMLIFILWRAVLQAPALFKVILGRKDHSMLHKTRHHHAIALQANYSYQGPYHLISTPSRRIKPQLWTPVVLKGANLFQAKYSHQRSAIGSYILFSTGGYGFKGTRWRHGPGAPNAATQRAPRRSTEGGYRIIFYYLVDINTNLRSSNARGTWSTTQREH